MRLLTSAIVSVVLAGQLGAQKANFSSESQLVVLHVAVRDRKGGYVGGLSRDAFRVFENKQRQPISFFSSQDAPVTIGLLIDSSGSMGPNREMVIAASMAFAKTSNPADEMFGEERLCAVLSQTLGTPEQVRDRVVFEVRSFAAGRAQNDDITVVVVRRD